MSKVKKNSLSTIKYTSSIKIKQEIGANYNPKICFKFQLVDYNSNCAPSMNMAICFRIAQRIFFYEHNTRAHFVQLL